MTFVIIKAKAIRRKATIFSGYYIEIILAKATLKVSLPIGDFCGKAVKVYERIKI